MSYSLAFDGISIFKEHVIYMKGMGVRAIDNGGMQDLHLTFHI
jgi:hypothetical protein